ncbi:MAG: hypothetical protein ACJ72X_18065 [Nitrososphaeraceae archaeon]
MAKDSDVFFTSVHGVDTIPPLSPQRVPIFKNAPKGCIIDYYYMMSLFSNKDIFSSEVESWRSFANILTSQQDKEMFKTLLSDYCIYIDVIVSNDNDESFPSEPLLTALIISQQKKIISWLIAKSLNTIKRIDQNNI